MPDDVIQAKVLKLNGSEILAETRSGNKLFLFLGHCHPEYKYLKKKKIYQFLLDIYTSLISYNNPDVKINVEPKHLLSYEFKKGSVYEGGIRTPMIVRWPGRIPKGKTSKTVWYFADFFPTAAELAGVRPPENIDGISVAEAFYSAEPSEKLARQLQNRFLYWEDPGKKNFHQAVRHGNWKAVRPEQGKNLELYDLSRDVGETTNVAEKYPKIVKKIEQFLKTCRIDSIHWPLGE